MPTVIGPATKKVHVVKYGGHNKASLYERLPGPAGREKTMEEYRWTVKRWWELWNVERNPEPEDLPEGDRFLIDKFGDFRAKDFAEKNMARVYFVGNPEIPCGKPVMSCFAAVHLPDDETNRFRYGRADSVERVQESAPAHPVRQRVLRPTARERELSFEEWRDLAMEAREVFGPDVAFGLLGGEPLLVPFAVDLAELIAKTGSPLTIFSNGTALVDSGIAQRVAMLCRAQSEGTAQAKPVAHPVVGSTKGNREDRHNVGGRFKGG